VFVDGRRTDGLRAHLQGNPILWRQV
jgi:hypothetical protein